MDIPQTHGLVFLSLPGVAHRDGVQPVGLKPPDPPANDGLAGRGHAGTFTGCDSGSCAGCGLGMSSGLGAGMTTRFVSWVSSPMQQLLIVVARGDLLELLVGQQQAPRFEDTCPCAVVKGHLAECCSSGLSSLSGSVILSP